MSQSHIHHDTSRVSQSRQRGGDHEQGPPMLIGGRSTDRWRACAPPVGGQTARRLVVAVAVVVALADTEVEVAVQVAVEEAGVAVAVAVAVAETEVAVAVQVAVEGAGVAVAVAVAVADADIAVAVAVAAADREAGGNLVELLVSQRQRGGGRDGRDGEQDRSRKQYRTSSCDTPKLCSGGKMPDVPLRPGTPHVASKPPQDGVTSKRLRSGGHRRKPANSGRPRASAAERSRQLSHSAKLACRGAVHNMQNSRVLDGGAMGGLRIHGHLCVRNRSDLSGIGKREANMVSAVCPLPCPRPTGTKHCGNRQNVSSRATARRRNDSRATSSPTCCAK